MDWVAPVVSGVSAVLSLVALVYVARVTAHGNHEKWLREERVRAAIQLKLAVSRVRVEFSHPTEGTRTDGDTRGFDFAEVNSAMAHLEVVGSPGVASEVEALRNRLREFIRASSGNEPGWRERREALDARMDSIILLVRKEVVL
jgi:hypothetical protein